YTGDPTAVEVLISQAVPTFFLEVIGFNASGVTARSVARQGASDTCVYVLNPSANKALWVTGSGDFDSACGIWVDSNDSKAVYHSGSGAIDTRPNTIQVVGSYYETGSGSMLPTPSTGASAPPDPDPFSSKPVPALTGTCDFTNKSVGGTASLTPGTYCG